MVAEPTADSLLDEHPASQEDRPGLLQVEEKLTPTAESVVPRTNKQDAFRGFNLVPFMSLFNLGLFHVSGCTF